MPCWPIRAVLVRAQLQIAFAGIFFSQCENSVSVGQSLHRIDREQPLDRPVVLSLTLCELFGLFPLVEGESVAEDAR